MGAGEDGEAGKGRCKPGGRSEEARICGFIRSWKTLVDGAPIAGSPGSIIELPFTDHIEASIITGGLHVLPVSGTENLLVTHLRTDSEEVDHRCIIGTLQNQYTSSALGISGGPL